MKTKTKVKKKAPDYADSVLKKDGLLTKKEVAGILKMSNVSVDRLVKSGQLKMKKLGNNPKSRCYYFKVDVLNFLGINE